jgi:hypothetical protein
MGHVADTEITVILTKQGNAMSLEQALKDNTAAVLAHNELLVKMIGSAKAPAVAETKAPATANKAVAKPATKTPAKKPVAKATTVDDIAKRFGGYLKTGDSEVREAAKVNVKAIVDYFGAAKATAIPEEHFDEALGYLTQYEAGEDVEFAGATEDEDGGEDEALV